METLMKEINNILQEKNFRISILNSENERLRNENTELKRVIEKLKENEVNKA